MKRIRFLFLIIMILFVSNQLFAQVNDVGKLVGIEGDVNIMRTGADKLIEVTARIKLYEGDKIITSSSGKVKIYFNDKSMVNLGPNTEFVVGKYVYDPVGKSRDSVLNLLKGASRLIVSKIFGGNSNFEIHTPTAVAGVRGTILHVMANPDENGNISSEIVTEEGSVVVNSVEDPDGTGQVVNANQQVHVGTEGGVSDVNNVDSNYVDSLSQETNVSEQPSTMGDRQMDRSPGTDKPESEINSEMTGEEEVADGGDDSGEGKDKKDKDKDSKEGDGKEEGKEDKDSKKDGDKQDSADDKEGDGESDDKETAEEGDKEESSEEESTDSESKDESESDSSDGESSESTDGESSEQESTDGEPAEGESSETAESEGSSESSDSEQGTESSETGVTDGTDTGSEVTDDGSQTDATDGTSTGDVDTDLDTDVDTGDTDIDTPSEDVVDSTDNMTDTGDGDFLPPVDQEPLDTTLIKLYVDFPGE